MEKLLLKRVVSPVTGTRWEELTVPAAFNCSNELDMIAIDFVVQACNFKSADKRWRCEDL
jgi:hypothetical protein